MGVIIENARGEILLCKQGDQSKWTLPKEFIHQEKESADSQFFSLYDLPENLDEAAIALIDTYAAEHFWIGG